MLWCERNQSEKATYCVTFWTRQSYENSKKIGCCQGLGRRGRGIGRTQRIFRAVKLFYTIWQCWIYVITHLLKPIECTPSRGNPNVNYVLWVIVMYQWSFLDYSKCTAPLGMLIAGDFVCEDRRRWELSVLSAEFCYELKMALKNKAY